MSEAQPTTPPASTPPATTDTAKKSTRWVVLIIAGSLSWYLLADRFTPYTQQARVEAFVIPVASEVAGQVTQVHVRDNQNVKAGELLFEIDSRQYQIEVDRARADVESTRRKIGANTAGVAAAQASLRAAEAYELKTTQDNQRLEGLYRDDPGTVSVRLLEVSRANREQAMAQVTAARSEIQRARELEGGPLAENAMLHSATTALEKAELDLANTKIRSSSAGLITDLRTAKGQFSAAGSPVMTLIAVKDIWINAEMTENNLGLLAPGTPVAVVLDARPGEVIEGRIRSIGHGIGDGLQARPGTLPSVQNSRDWLRPAQRFPVIIDIPSEQSTDLRGLRAGGQAEVMAFPSETNPLNVLGRGFLHLMSWLSYAY
ncbi:HlyD family secretion protein [Pseudomonas sp. NPDC098747]|uniref:HlyD family secretion protein n=1 Tax=Pseudomonas sp. NPDC098747 TaxID=3364487 RepID=UPI00383B74F3